MSTITTTRTDAVPTTVIDNRTWLQRFEANAGAKVKLASTYAGPLMGIVLGIVATLWKLLSLDQQTGLLAGLGIGQVWTGVAVACITHWAAVFKPAASGALSPQLLDALQQVALWKLNATLVKLGQPEVPVPAAALTAEPAVRLLSGLGAGLAPTAAPPAPAEFADTQHVDLLLEPVAPTATPAVPATRLAAAQFLGRNSLLAANRVLRPAATPEQILAELQAEIRPSTATG